MGIKEKVKGAIAIGFGILMIIFTYQFDALVGRPRHLAAKAFLGLGFGLIMIVNGIRIYLRKNRVK